MTTEERLAAIETQLAKIYNRQKLIAKSIANLALGLNIEANTNKTQRAEQEGLLLGILSELRAKHERKRRDSDDTSEFGLPGGEREDRIRLTKRTQRRILKWAIVSLIAATLHVAQWLWQARGFPH